MVGTEMRPLLRHVQRPLRPGWALCSPAPDTVHTCTEQARACEHGPRTTRAPRHLLHRVPWVPRTRCSRCVCALCPQGLVLLMTRPPFSVTESSQMNTHDALFPHKVPLLLLFVERYAARRCTSFKLSHVALDSETDSALQPSVSQPRLPLHLHGRAHCVSSSYRL